MTLRRSMVHSARAIFQALGLAVFPWRKDHSYVPSYFGRSAHKHIDIRELPGFGPLATASISAGKSLLYYDRLYVIYQALANVRRTLPEATSFNTAEVGVYRGGTSHFILSSLKQLGIESASLHAFDTFEGHAAVDITAEKDTFHQPKFFSDTRFEDVRNYLKDFDNITLYKGRFQENCHNIANKCFAFVHLDMDIFEPTAFALDFFDKRLATGGIIVVDDYGFTTCSGIKQAVDEFVNARRDYFALHQLTGQCILVKCQEHTQ